VATVVLFVFVAAITLLPSHRLPVVVGFILVLQQFATVGKMAGKVLEVLMLLAFYKPIVASFVSCFQYSMKLLHFSDSLLTHCQVLSPYPVLLDVFNFLGLSNSDLSIVKPGQYIF
jgi:hypothetical protein